MNIRSLPILGLLAACQPAQTDVPPFTAEPPLAAEPPLELNIDPDRVTVSGVSSGAYMAGQLHVAHSSLFSGAGLLAGGPYRCAGGSVQQALGPCAKSGDLDVNALAASARRLAEAGAIDGLEDLADDRVWVFHGTADAVVAAAVPAAAAGFYEQYMPAENIVVVDDVPAAHGMPTVATGVACGEAASPYLNACGYDAAGELLAHLHGPLEQPAEETTALRTLDQRPFADAGLWEQAFLYVPEACADGASCGLHVALHGCLQSAELVGDAFASGAGYNRWAESNRLVILYPQVRGAPPANPLGCWDWWGYTGDAYATKQGIQVSAVRSLIDALMT